MKPTTRTPFLILVVLLSQMTIGNLLLAQPNEKVKILIKKANQSDNPTASLDYLKEAYQLVYDLNDSLEADLYFNLGVAHGKLYHIDSSKYFFNQALNLVSNSVWDLMEIGVLNGLGNVARIENQNETASQYFHKALVKSQSNNELVYLNWRAKLLGNLAGVYFDLEDFNIALNYSKEALLLARDIKDDRSIAYTYSQLGYLYVELDSLEEALNCSQKSTAYFENVNDSLGLIYQYYSLGLVYSKLGDLEKSKINFLLSKQLADKFEEAETYAGSLNHLGAIALNQRNIDTSRKYANEAMSYTQSNKLITHLKRAYDLLYKIEKVERNFEKALAYRNLFFDLNDSIQNSKAISSINKLNAKYKFDKNENQISQLIFENNQKQSLIESSKEIRNGIIIIAVIFISIVVLLLFRQRNRYSTQIDTLQNEIAELKLDSSDSKSNSKSHVHTFSSLNDTLATPLSQREFEVLELAFAKKTNNEIAEELYVSVNTVKTHLKNLYDKLGVSNRKDAVKKFLHIEKKK